MPPGGEEFYYFSVYCLQIQQQYRNIHSAPWWRRVLLLLCLLFADMTAQLEPLQCPLVEMDSITSLFNIYRYNSSTGTFTVPPGGDGFYYFSSHFLVLSFEFAGFAVEINGETICSAYGERESSPNDDPGPISCSGASFAAEGKT